MTAGIQRGETCQIPTCLKHDVMHSSNHYSANGLSFILNISFYFILRLKSGLLNQIGIINFKFFLPRGYA